MPPILVVADDLTGACDSAAGFLGSAKSVRVFRDARATQKLSLEPGAVFAFTTESRNMRASDAAYTVERAIASVVSNAGNKPILLKKIDSAARGHFAAEILSALSASGAALALVAPAFPHAGRIVSNGKLHIRDAAQQATNIDLPSLFPASHRGWMDLLPVGAPLELEHSIARAIEHGTRVLLCDATTQQDLDRLATAAYRVNQPLLWTGSAGLAQALASLFPVTGAAPTPGTVLREGRRLLFIGTDHPVTQLQVSHLLEERTASDLKMHRIDWKDTTGAGVRAAFQQGPVAALVLTGGDTAAFVLATLKTEAIRLAGEIAPGVPWGYIEGGEADGCMVVTKSGGFGQADALLHALKFCTRRICEPA